MMQVYMALSNCRSNGNGLRLRYRLEVFGFASDDRCASGASPLVVVSRRSLTVHIGERWSSTPWTSGRQVAALVFRYEQCKNVGGLALVLSILAVLTALQTWERSSSPYSAAREIITTGLTGSGRRANPTVLFFAPPKVATHPLFSSIALFCCSIHVHPRDNELLKPSVFKVWSVATVMHCPEIYIVLQPQNGATGGALQQTVGIISLFVIFEVVFWGWINAIRLLKSQHRGACMPNVLTDFHPGFGLRSPFL